MLRWRDIKKHAPPDDALGVAILVEVTCKCAKGGIVALMAGRQNGEWIIQDFKHEFDITHWLKLPPFVRRSA
jgi:hypothetical protein